MQTGIKIIWTFVIALSLTVLFPRESKAQRLAVSTNALEYLVLSPNITIDAAFSRHHAVSVSVSACPWEYSENTYLRHFTWSPEYKYWLTMLFYRSYIGGKLLYSSYDLGTKKLSKKGIVTAVLADYGYSFILSKRFNVIPSVGLGAGYNFAETNKIVPVVSIGVNAQIVLK